MLSYLASSQLFRGLSKFGNSTTVHNLLHTSPVYQKKKKEKKADKKEDKKGPKRVAVVLCGCGGQDGTEIYEAVSISIHLAKNNMVPMFYAPNVNICETMNHFTSEPDEGGQPRNALVEAARLARSRISPLCTCNTCDKDALIVPGGLGAAKTLSNFASHGSQCTVHPELEALAKQFNCESKPIGSLCIASALMAKIFHGVTVTLGKDCPTDAWPYATSIEHVKKMCANHEMHDVKGVAYCKQYHVFSNPAWLYAKANYDEVHIGIGNLIAKMKEKMK